VNSQLKTLKLQEVADAAIEYRESQVESLSSREQFIDAIVEAVEAGATHEEIAKLCPTLEDETKRLSRQRIGQFIRERV
jgi:lipoate-protein ligase A